MGTDIRGAEVVKKMMPELEKEIESLKEKDIIPQLAIVRVGEDPDDKWYENSAVKRFENLGLRALRETLPEDATQEDFDQTIEKLNQDDDINGVLILNPLPEGLKIESAMEKLDPLKDVDGLTYGNMAKVYQGDDTGFAPCTAVAVMDMIEDTLGSVTGKKVTIIGSGLVIGKPVSLMCMNNRATITVCNSRTPDTLKEAREADIIISAVGVAEMVDDNYVREGQMVVDVGINEDAEGNLVGDVDYDKVAPIVDYITPVPGGVGNVTTFILAKHTVKATKLQNNC